MRRAPALAIGLLGGLILAGAGAAPLTAAVQHPLSQLPLTPEDMEMAGSVVDRLYQAKSVGTTEGWSNDASGNSGTVTILELFEAYERQCRRVRHVLTFNRVADPRTVEFRSCLDDDGEWKLI